MTQDIDAKELSARPRETAKLSAGAQENDVYEALGALLGMLEVIASDESALAPRQAEHVRTAIGCARRLEQYVDALLLLAAEDLPRRLKLGVSRLGPLLEHAARGAQRGLEANQVALRWPAREGWGNAYVRVDASRLDRTLAALIGALAKNARRASTLAVEVEARHDFVEVALRGEAGARVFASGLLERACARLLELSGGRFALDPSVPGFALWLPRAETP